MKKLRLISTLFSLVICTFLHAEVTNGKCGDNLTWTFNSETGLLKIEGSGEMYYYGYYNKVPWYSYQIKAIELPNGITNIGSSAFSDCRELASVTIPNTVTNIEDNAFYGCSRLKSVNIPNSVDSIGNNAFDGCSGLTSINIPNSVTTIGDMAFANCKGLTSVTIPSSITSIRGGVLLLAVAD